jgi:hypothetical protein
LNFSNGWKAVIRSSRLNDASAPKRDSGATIPPAAMNKIANVENVVCSVETMYRHRELYHYTKSEAFEKIVASQTLWCSHYREMVDTNEVRLMRALLPPAVAPRMDAIVQTFDWESRRIWNDAGGGAEFARGLINELYGKIFDGAAGLLRNGPLLVFVFDSRRRHCA